MNVMPAKGLKDYKSTIPEQIMSQQLSFSIPPMQAMNTVVPNSGYLE